MLKKITALLTAGVMIFSANALTLNALAFSAESISENTQIVSETYYSYGDLKYSVLDDGTIEIIGLKDDTVSSIDIPAEIDGKKVVSIGKSAFYDCANLKSIDIPDSVTSTRNIS